MPAYRLVVPLLAVCAVLPAAVFKHHATTYETDAHRLAAALHTSDLPDLPVGFTERHEMASLLSYFNQDWKRRPDFAVIEGDNKTGKTTIAAVVARRLAADKIVRWRQCAEGQSAQDVLRALFDLDAPLPWTNSVYDSILGRTGTMEYIGSAELNAHLKPRAANAPVFFLEAAEVLELPVLKRLINTAKELADARAAYFVFIFSPSNKLRAITDFGSFSRARVVYVGDMTQAEAFAYLAANLGCDEERSQQIFETIGGYLPHLQMPATVSFCGGDSSFADFTLAMMTEVEKRAKATADELVLGEAAHAGGNRVKLLCGLLCDPHIATFPQRDVLDDRKLTRRSLKDESPVVAPRLSQLYVERTCACNTTDQ